MMKNKSMLRRKCALWLAAMLAVASVPEAVYGAGISEEITEAYFTEEPEVITEAYSAEEPGENITGDCAVMEPEVLTEEYATTEPEDETEADIAAVPGSIDGIDAEDVSAEMPEQTAVINPSYNPAVSDVYFSLEGGTYTEAQEVTLSCNQGCVISCTTDGSDPYKHTSNLTQNSPTGQLYGNPITINVSESMTIRAVAYRPACDRIGNYVGNTIEKTYLIVPKGSAIITPKGSETADDACNIYFSVAGGTYLEAQTVSLNCTPGWKICYTTDGSSPLDITGTGLNRNGKGNAQTVTETVSESTTIKAVAYRETGLFKYEFSETVEQTYNIVPEGSIAEGSVIFSATEGTYIKEKTVKLTCASGWKIIYTTNGRDPITILNGKAVFTQGMGQVGPVTVTMTESTMIRAVAYRGDTDNYEFSDIAEQTYMIVPDGSTLVGDIVFSVAGGTYKGMQTITLSRAPGWKIFYRTDGGSLIDESNGKVFPGGSGQDSPVTVTLTESATIRAVAYKGDLGDGFEFSDIAEQTYIIKQDPVVTEAPKAIEGLTYDGTEQTLITEGAVTGGTIYYAVTDAGAAEPDESLFSSIVPAKTDAKKYDVWYLVAGDEGLNNLAAQHFEAEIHKGDFPKKALSKNIRYGMSDSIDLSSYIAQGGETGVITVSSDQAVFNQAPTLEGTTLKYSIKDLAEFVGNTATVTIPVRNADNYADYEIKVDLTVIFCSHEHTQLRNVIEANCTQAHYTGDVTCTECGYVVEAGHYTATDPDKHDFDGGIMVKEPTVFVKGETKYTCKRCGHEKIVADIPCLEKPGEDYGDLREDTKDLSGNAVPKIETGRDDKGNEVTTVSVNGTRVEEVVKDPVSGKETVKSVIWIGGLEKTYAYTGSAIKPAINVYDGTKKLTEKTDYTVSYKNNKEVGTNATVSVRFKGNYSNAKAETATFEITGAELGRDIIAHDTGVTDKKKVNKTAPIFTWAKTGKSLNSGYFKIEYGEVINDACTATIRPKSNYSNKFSGQTTAVIKVVSNKNLLLQNAKVTFDPKSYTYTGSVITPSYKVKIGNTELVKGTDFTETIQDNIIPGKATVYIKAKPGNAKGYVGSKTATFKVIAGRVLKDGAPFDITVDKSVPYAKGGAKASVTVRDGNTLLKEGVDYTLSYKKNTSVTSGETAEVQIKGKGLYKGNITRKFSVKRQNLKALENNVVIKDQFTTKDKLKKPSVTITDLDGKELTSWDYVIDAVDDKDPKNTDTAGVVRVTIKAKNSNAYEGTCSATFRYMDRAADISKAKLEKKIADQEYTGSEVKLSVEDLKGALTVGTGTDKKELVPGTDFVITGYSKNIKNGTAKVKLKGIGNYGGTKTITFKIVRKKISFQGALVGGEWK